MKDLIFTTILLLAITLSPLVLAQITHSSKSTPGKTGAADSSGVNGSSSTSGSTNRAPEVQNPATGTDASKAVSK